MKLFLYQDKFDNDQFKKLVECLEKNGIVVEDDEKSLVGVHLEIPTQNGDYDEGYACKIWGKGVIGGDGVNERAEFGTFRISDLREVADALDDDGTPYMSILNYLNIHSKPVVIGWESKDEGVNKRGRKWYKNDYGQVMDEMTGQIIYPDSKDHPSND